MLYSLYCMSEGQCHIVSMQVTQRQHRQKTARVSTQPQKCGGMGFYLLTGQSALYHWQACGNMRTAAISQFWLGGNYFILHMFKYIMISRLGVPINLKVCVVLKTPFASPFLSPFSIMA
jgi:hypothetical protein